MHLPTFHYLFPFPFLSRPLCLSLSLAHSHSVIPSLSSVSHPTKFPSPVRSMLSLSPIHSNNFSLSLSLSHSPGALSPILPGDMLRGPVKQHVLGRPLFLTACSPSPELSPSHVPQHGPLATWVINATAIVLFCMTLCVQPHHLWTPVSKDEPTRTLKSSSLRIWSKVWVMADSDYGLNSDGLR